MSQVVYLSQMTLADLTVIGQGEIRSDCRQTISSRHAWTQPDKITIPTIHMLPHTRIDLHHHSRAAAMAPGRERIAIGQPPQVR